MNKDLVQKKEQSKIKLECLFQLIASIAWATSVFVYGSYGLGDRLQ